ncbi:iron-sulfur cluster assembly accessory protein [Buchnera aphidicola (Hyadaphis tataricae)]|uniref:Iron-sulfur cluster assembly accessory protein n=1 Tax=Buchnera aphidicola (Hyadaphis tataricae) TaxID=1241859 RepID=A0A4D6Y503_9GAMM|nr:iron-sulfur cluster assembly accessory protein [Buchnera aphidicola]QCI21438.1 iron-sulfur cluster assembly accessory protein [Buchnera aphidicola (Hyadaphis tataricae)]
MKKKIVDHYIINKNKWKDFSITEDAIKQILFLIKSNPDNKGIKLGIKKSGCAGFRYNMALITHAEFQEKYKKKMNTFVYKNIVICISSEEIPFLSGIKIDFVQNNINKIFKFYNPKLKNFCGCGDSFAIDNNDITNIADNDFFYL